MGFFPKRFGPLQNSNKFQIGFFPGIYNSKPFWNLNSFPKGKLFLLNLSITWTNLEICGEKSATFVFYKLEAV
jgi:hypothetical protein